MAVISVKVPENLAKQFKPFQVIEIDELEKEKSLLSIDWDWWNGIEVNEPIENVLEFLKSVNK